MPALSESLKRAWRRGELASLGGEEASPKLLRDLALHAGEEARVSDGGGISDVGLEQLFVHHQHFPEGRDRRSFCFWQLVGGGASSSSLE